MEMQPQSQTPSSFSGTGGLTLMMQQQQQSLEPCNCGRGEKVMFQCDEQTCKYYQTQKLYCPFCMVPERHPHIPVLIAMVNKNVIDEWDRVRKEIDEFDKKVDEEMSIHERLVELLDGYVTNPNNTFRFSLDRIETLKVDFENFYIDKIVKSVSSGEYFRVQQFKPEIQSFKQRVAELENFKNINPSLLWEYYKEVFENVSQEQAYKTLSHKENETMLKFKLNKMRITLQERLQDKAVYISDNFMREKNCTIVQAVREFYQSFQSLEGNHYNVNPKDVLIVERYRNEIDSMRDNFVHYELQVKINKLEKQEIKSRVKILDLEEKYIQIINILKKQSEEQKHCANQIDVSLKKQFLNSLIINDEEKSKIIRAYFEQAGLALDQSQLLYRGSLHTFSGPAFHKLCDNKPKTLTIVQSTDGKIVGGFSTQTWNHCDQNYKSDPHAWLFNLESPSIFKVQPGKESYAVYAASQQGPCFGGGCDLFIGDNCDNNSNSKVAAHSYDYRGNGNLFLKQEQENFIVAEIEVFQV
ncbi:hypothetical protein FGO68_gene17435 [Halteria grandinella]|uniref:TLDc domain-containing protein n=1 Tax=Halteria grandinella TaxID=5974 RepID=A0A8J8NTK7_HALGN|nr:hypothetical protein FGO68_gene17435 [Halteria grandinella]